MANSGGEQPGLNLLSFDGGGITGLSSLLILKDIMTRLQAKEKRESIPKPCEYFDMIVGTSTGAISAVMLGRLRMSIDDAIGTYVRLMRAVFSERKYTITGNTGAFKSTVLERELKCMARFAAGNENEKMRQEMQVDGVQCKVIVYAMSAYNLTSSLPVAFRSYISATTTSCTIWEVLRATTAHPQLFKPIEVDIDGTGVRNMFTHGALGCTNPTPRLLEEARVEFPGRSVTSIVSIGAGHPKTIQVITGEGSSHWVMGGSTMMKVMRSAQEMAEGSERVAEEMARRFGHAGLVYYRLNVQQGTQGVGASDLGRLDEVAAHTQAYLHQAETVSRLESVVETICSRVRTLDISQIDGRIIREAEPLNHWVRSCPLSSVRFTGRGHHIARVQRYFTRGSQGRSIFVIYGLGGSGKTQIALKCVEELKGRFLHVIFVDASSEQSIHTSLATIALANHLGRNHEDALKWIGQHAQSCLLVLDNADNPKLNLQAYLPCSADYNVLVTTRCPEFADLTDDIDAVCNVSGMEEDEAVELLLKTAKLRLEQMSEADKVAMNQLLKSFYHLALAIVQSGAYIWKMKLSISQYWDRYSTRQQMVPEGGVASALKLDGYPRTVYTTWDMSLSQLTSHAQQLLFLVSFLHRDGITENIFRRAVHNFQECNSDIPLPSKQLAVLQRLTEFLSYLTDDGQWNDMLSSLTEELMSFSLITYDQASESYSIHPLVQSWARLVASRQSISLDHSILLLGLSIDWGKSHMDYAYKRQILPHLNLVTGQSQVCDLIITDRFAEVYRAVGQFQNEADQWERTITAWKQELGESHHKTLSCISSLAVAYQELGRLVVAKELQEATLAAQIRTLGEDHPDVLRTKHKLGWTMYQQDHYAEAEALLESVVVARKQVLGQDHPDTLESMDDLASSYEARGRLAEAESLRMEALAIRKQILGEDHMDTLDGMGNLAVTYQKQGRLDEAEALYATTITARKRVLGEDHPHTLTSMHNLASTYKEQGRLDEAVALYASVVATRKRVLGEDHPDTLTIMHNLANTYQEQGRLDEAKALYATTITARKRVLGENHPHTLISVHCLAYTYQEQGRLDEAEALYATTITARKRVLGEDHPHTLTSMHELAYTYQEQGRLDKAEALYAAIFATQKRVLGEDHPDTLTSMHNLAATYYFQDRFVEAEALFMAVLASRRRVLGPTHLRTITSKVWLEGVYSKLGKTAERDALRSGCAAI